MTRLWIAFFTIALAVGAARAVHADDVTCRTYGHRTVCDNDRTFRQYGVTAWRR